MLPFKNRLKKEKDFSVINHLGRSFFSSYFRFKYLKNNFDFSRFAVVISTKVSKKATVRNRLRRQLSEIIRLNQSKIKPGYDIIISVSTAALGRKYEDLEKNLLALFTKAKLLK